MGTKDHPGTFDCYEAAEPDEPLFVLLARDAVAPMVVRTWARERRERLARLAHHGGGTALEAIEELDQIAEAFAVADAMDRWRADRKDASPPDGSDE